MSVRITQIDAQKIGPLDRFSLTPKSVNLIYGRNEQGKTHLVEFLIRSLFRVGKSWPLREQGGTGKVTVQGLSDKDAVFSPNKPEKIEDFWAKSDRGLPPYFNRLLVVKGAEAELSQSGPEGVNRAVVRYFLSNQQLLDQIRDKGIDSATILKCEIRDGNILGDNKGALKDRSEHSRRLGEIDALFDRIDRDYTGGALKELRMKQAGLSEKISIMERARRFAAFELDQQLKEVEAQKKQIDEKKLREMREELALYRQSALQLKQKSDQRKRAAEASRHYEWLQKAIEFYRENLKQSAGGSHWIWAALSVSMAALSAVLILLHQSTLALIPLLCAVFLIGLYFIQTRKAIRSVPTTQEIQRIRSEFEEKFGSVLPGLADMEARLDAMQRDYQAVRILDVQLGDEKSSLDARENRLSVMISHLAGKRVTHDLWDRVLSDQEEQLRKLNDRADSIRRDLARLDVAPEDYLESSPGRAYDRGEHDALQKELGEIQQAVQENKQKQDTLKQLICTETGDDISIDWELLIQHLREKRREVLADYQRVTAEILGKKAVQSVLDVLRQEEDRKIEEGLASETILKPLYQMTGRYTGLRLDGEELLVFDAVHDFAFSDLSTGAQEQVLLSLRIGFALKWLRRENDQLFLILDDAFQYSDWQRRERLVETVFGLAKSGWQIFYFTMDDHLKGLFDQAGKSFGTEYLCYDLESPVL